MDYKCEVKELPAQPVLSIRTKSAVQELPQVLGASLGAIAQYLGSLGENPRWSAFCRLLQHGYAEFGYRDRLPSLLIRSLGRETSSPAKSLAASLPHAFTSVPTVTWVLLMMR